MTIIRRARPEDAAAIGAVHVAAWRDAYAGLLPDDYLAGLSVTRIAANYHRGLVARRAGEAMFVAEAGDAQGRPRVIGFASSGRARRPDLADGEVETLYVLPDWREQGLGRRLLRASSAHLAAIGCATAVIWVLSGNHAQWFYHHLGGKPVRQEEIRVGGRPMQQMAMHWDPIGALLSATATSSGAGRA